MRVLFTIIAIAFSSTVAAFPGQSDDCVGCHSANTDQGTVSVAPTIVAGIGSTGNTVTFSLSGLPTPVDGGSGMLALWDRDGLAPTIGTPDSWSDEGTNFQSIVLDNNDTSYILTFDVASTATLGSYLFDVYLAGDDAPVSGDTRWIDTTSFNVKVVPIPAAVWLFGSGLLGLIGVARTRRNKT